jgi:hypothetical protein
MLRRTLVLLVVPFLWAQVPEHVEYAPDIDAWRAELFAGAVLPGGVLQGPAREAGFREPIQMCFLTTGEMLISTDGVILMGDGKAGFRILAGTPGLTGYHDGPAAQALLGRQMSMCSDGRGGAYIGDRSNRLIRRLTRRGGQWVVETVAGDPAKPPSIPQLVRVRDEGDLPPPGKPDVIDGTGRAARFTYLHSNVAADAEGNAWVMDSDFLRRITPQGKVETLNLQGGTGNPAGDIEPLASAHFRLIMQGGIAFGGDGNLYVGDHWNHGVRKVDLRARTVTFPVGPGGGYIDGPEKKAGFHTGTGYIVYDPWRKRFYTNGVDDWGLRAWQNGRMATVAGGARGNSALEGPARTIATQWCGVLAVDPRPPHAIYFWSNRSNWRGRIGRLFRAGEEW